MVKKINKNIYSPLRYPGGKGCIFPFVSKLFYENQLLGMDYAEPYAGGAGLALRLLFEGFVDRIYLNDIDRSIFSFWKTILNQPDEFCEWLKTVKVDIKHWNYYKSLQANSKYLDDFELAKSTFYLNRTNISGVISGGVIGGQEQKGKYKINARFNKADLIYRIKRIATLRDRIFFSNLDGLEFIKMLERKKLNVFIYLDPPYFQKGAELYMNFYKERDHKALSDQVSKLKSKWIVSYDKHKFILNLYSDKNKITYKLSQSTSNRTGDEILIFSDKLKYASSIKSLTDSRALYRRP